MYSCITYALFHCLGSLACVITVYTCTATVHAHNVPYSWKLSRIDEIIEFREKALADCQSVIWAGPYYMKIRG